ncbi:MAG: phosphoenolpyruvate--protein phosphotransferase [Gammaproteobacteria bacterium]|nr:phosphoenolpyruvate--protein phosphotransferase [Gammaproteobacteria bacterium]
MSFLSKIFNSGKEAAAQPQAATGAQTPPPAEEAESPVRLTLDDILLAQRADDKVQALRMIAQRMLASGYVSADYTQALMEREQKVSTYLINGVAIPHGALEAKHLVARTGIVVAQFPAGVTWNDKGDVVKLAVGIAANGNEHMKILTQLTNVVMDQALATHLGEQADAAEIAAALDQPIEAPRVVAEDLAVTAETTIVDQAGMHARPASTISELAAGFADTEIRLRNGARMANAKSMAEILAMGAIEGDRIVVSAQGAAAQAAVSALAELIGAGLDNDDENGAGFSDYRPSEGLAPIDDAAGRLILHGAAASPGIALAPVHLFSESVPEPQRESADPAGELSRLEQSLEKAAEQLEALYLEMKKTAANEATIFRAQIQLLRDEVILAATRELIAGGNSAAWSWHTALQAQIATLEAVEDERIKARVSDMRDVAARLVCILEERDASHRFPSDHDFVLLARELTPSQTASLDTLPVKAICTELGGPNSHMAILARALGIPAIVGIGPGLTEQAEDGEAAVVDPQSASLTLSPDATTLAAAEQRLATWSEIQARENAQKFEPAITRDQRHIDLVCNIAKPKEAAAVLENGGAGVGLLRTEFMFEASESEPMVSEQFDALWQIAETLGSRQLVVRTADIGGDKPVSWLDMPHEENPFLGVRGIRHSFRHLRMFRHQLEAIYRVARKQREDGVESGIHIMFPMICKLSEWRKARAIAEEVRAGLDAPRLPLGIMVEIPAAALLAHHFAQEVDFFSIGSNDLTQYTLAMDRLHPDLAAEADSFSPALLRLIAMTVEAAEAHGKWVGVCGNMAADPVLASILLGLGVHEISVSPANVPQLKMLIRSSSYEQLRERAQQALTLGTSQEIKALYRQR